MLYTNNGEFDHDYSHTHARLLMLVKDIINHHKADWKSGVFWTSVYYSEKFGE